MFFIRRKKNRVSHPFTEEKEIDEVNAEETNTSFVLGVEDVFKLLNEQDNVIVGNVVGTVHKGEAVYISNPGSDQDEIILTTIVGIELKPGMVVEKATNCPVGLKIQNGSQYPLRKGSVLFTKASSSKDVQDVYINTLANVYVKNQKLELSDTELKGMSITDCAEVWRIYTLLQSDSTKEESTEEKECRRRRIDRLAKSLCEKVLKAELIYCIYNKETGEPHMFSKTVLHGDGYLCTPPDIRIITKAYLDKVKKFFPEDRFEIKPIVNGEAGDGIYNFLGSTFYLNGACGIQILFEQVSIANQMFVPEPDYSHTPKQNIPVTNPDLERWQLLLGQLGEPEGEDQKTIYKLYYRFMARELVKADLLIPMRKDGEFPEPDNNGKSVLKKDMSIHFPTMEGKNDRPAVYMFTDWKRLRMDYDESWEGMVQSVEGMIGVFDCAINATQYPKAGSYIGKELFEGMKQIK